MRMVIAAYGLLGSVTRGGCVRIGGRWPDLFRQPDPRRCKQHLASTSFNISNFTGDPLLAGFALPPDFPVLDFLTFSNSSLTLNSGGVSTVISLGDIGPGALSPTDPVQFPDTASFSSVVFTANLKPGQLSGRRRRRFCGAVNSDRCADSSVVRRVSGCRF